MQAGNEDRWLSSGEDFGGEAEAEDGNGDGVLWLTRGDV